MSEDSQHKNNIQIVIEAVYQLDEPSLYHVMLLNDDFTTMEFVIEILMLVFNKDYNQAYQVMLEVHHNQRGIAGTYTKEIAKEKQAQVHTIATEKQFPLRCTIEKS